MGERGPAAKPKALLKKRGSWRGDVGNKIEAAVDREVPPPPKELIKAEKKIYNELVAMLSTLPGLLAKLDVYALARYAQLFYRWKRAEKIVRIKGETYEITSDNGETIVKERPESKISLALHDRLLKMERQFGMTPSARAGLANALLDAKHKHGSNPEEKFF